MDLSHATKAELGVSIEYQLVAPIIVGRPKKLPEVHERQPLEINWLDG